MLAIAENHIKPNSTGLQKGRDCICSWSIGLGL